MANIVGTGLFGDGAAAIVMVGEDSPHTGGIRVSGSRSAVYPDSADAIGWRIGSTGFRLMLSPAVPHLIDQHLAGDIDTLLGEHGLTRKDIGSWIAHPGGPRVLEAFSESARTFPHKPCHQLAGDGGSRKPLLQCRIARAGPARWIGPPDTEHSCLPLAQGLA